MGRYADLFPVVKLPYNVEPLVVEDSMLDGPGRFLGFDEYIDSSQECFLLKSG